MQEFSKAHGACLLHFLQHVGCGFLTHALQAQQVVQRQAIEVSTRRDEVGVEHLINEFLTHTVQLQSAAPVEHGTACSSLAKQIDALEEGALEFHLPLASRASGR